ncbi:MAG: hypothetical protein NTX95_01010 [Actinobacteria bacterium]|nr:hypothetical protein [Actinomycetota bacterium]
MSSRAWQLLDRRRRALVEIAIAISVGLLSSGIAYRMIGAHRPDLSKPWADGDGLTTYWLVKAMQQHGWYSPNPSLGFPFGQDLNPFPNLDLLHLLELKALSLISANPYLPVNLFVFWGFFAVGASTYLLMRYATVRRLIAIPLAISLSLAPWHFQRLSGHFFLADYSSIAVGLFLAVFATRAVRRAGAPDSGLTRRSDVVFLAIAAAAGFYVAGCGLYWAFASLALIAISVIPALVANPTWRGAFRAATALAAVPFFAFAWLTAQKLLSNASNGGQAFQRQYIESEMYGGALTALFLGSPLSGIPRLATSRVNWESMTQIGLGNESSPWNSLLGIVAVSWTVILIFLAISTLRNPPDAPGPSRFKAFHELIRKASVDGWLSMALLSLLMFAVTGIGTLVMLWVFKDIRVWGRFALPLIVVATVVLGVSLTHATRRRPNAAAAIIITLLLSAVVYADQIQGSYRRDFTTFPTVAADAQKYVQAIEGDAHSGCGVLTLPILPFPESWPIFQMKDYDPLWLYMGSNDLAFTYGIPKNLPEAAWQDRFADPKTMEEIDALRARGICGISIDTAGYERPNPPIVARLADLTGNGPIRSPSGRWVYIPI